MSEVQKSASQRVSDLELRLKQERAKAATERAKLLVRCARLLHQECPDEMRRLVVKFVKPEEWSRLKKLGINEHLPAKRGTANTGTTQELASVVPVPGMPDQL